MATPALGAIGWVDLTIGNADQIRDFYSAVTGWTFQSLEMKDGGAAYNDYCMVPPGAETPVAGICHRRGSNATLPPVWIVYITVADLDASLAKVTALGGRILKQPAAVGSAGRYALVEDPAGAVCGLYQSA